MLIEAAIGAATALLAYVIGRATLPGMIAVFVVVVEAGERAVAESLAWLEREACFVRRGTNNRAARLADPESWGTRRLPAQGFVGAQFRHRTSRAGDPQLHWHVLVANTTCGMDGRWSALDGTALYRTKRVAAQPEQITTSPVSGSSARPSPPCHAADRSCDRRGDQTPIGCTTCTPVLPGRSASPVTASYLRTAS